MSKDIALDSALKVRDKLFDRSHNLNLCFLLPLLERKLLILKIFLVHPIKGVNIIKYLSIFQYDSRFEHFFIKFLSKEAVNRRFELLMEEPFLHHDVVLRDIAAMDHTKDIIN
jgi:hypothetical protein